MNTLLKEQGRAMASERFVVEACSERPEYDENADGRCVVDTQTDTVIGADGGEPEDQTLYRDWSWVVRALNAIEAERARVQQERDEAQSLEREHVTRAQDVADEMRRERDAAIAERDELRVTLENRALAGAGVAFDIKELQDELLLAQDSVMRMRRELKALQDDMRRRADASDGELFDDLLTRVLKEYADRLTAILTGAKS